MTDFRLESDSIGEKKVPKDAYYGVQSLRGKENFFITGNPTHPEMIRGLAMVKKGCAMSNNKAGVLADDKANAIIKACDRILDGEFLDQFIADPIQGGAGTISNMNANEVIANIANEILGGGLGTYEHVHPNDHVNMGQSTNDAFPTSGKIGALNLLEKLYPELDELVKSLGNKAKEFENTLKMGRTQLQDAVPITLGQEFNAYQSAIKRDIKRIKHAAEALKVVNMGASAIGTGINVDKNYFNTIVPDISEVTGFDLKQAEDLVDGTQNIDCFAEVSGALKCLAINMSKMSNDLRLMGSGPKTMVGDINLPPRANGSSIMPGKVNPIIPEVVSQSAFRVIGNDVTITMCAEGGQMELNAFEPVALYSLYQSIEFLTHAANTLRINCIDGITANEEKLKADIEHSVGIVTALVPHIGYVESARIAKEALRTGKPLRELILRDKLMTEENLNRVLDPKEMTHPGIAAEELLLNK
ncbi:MAG: aspartate ammonia-lyase [Tissierellia bacterium]|nr:aspartate ammonia-lyase [Tissierellia bacterium]